MGFEIMNKEKNIKAENSVKKKMKVIYKEVKIVLRKFQEEIKK